MDQEVRYKRLGKGRTVTQVGTGRVINISSKGILFSTESLLPQGERIEVSVSWPARLNDTTPLKLVILGSVVRGEEKQAAVSIDHYEFKTRRAGGL